MHLLDASQTMYLPVCCLIPKTTLPHVRSGAIVPSHPQELRDFVILLTGVALTHASYHQTPTDTSVGRTHLSALASLRGQAYR